MLCLTKIRMDSIHCFYSDDHRRLDELFLQLQSGHPSGRGGARRAFGAFRRGLERHMDWEEQLLFPLLSAAAAPAHQQLADLLCWEHRHLRLMLNGVEEHIGRDDWDSRLERTAYSSLLAAHNSLEERLVYPLLDRATTPEDRCRLWSQMHVDPAL